MYIYACTYVYIPIIYNMNAQLWAWGHGSIAAINHWATRFCNLLQHHKQINKRFEFRNVYNHRHQHTHAQYMSWKGER